MLCSPSMCRARNHVGSNADFMLARSPSCPGPPTRAGVGGAMAPPPVAPALATLGFGKWLNLSWVFARNLTICGLPCDEGGLLYKNAEAPSISTAPAGGKMAIAQSSLTRAERRHIAGCTCTLAALHGAAGRMILCTDEGSVISSDVAIQHMVVPGVSSGDDPKGARSKGARHSEINHL